MAIADGNVVGRVIRPTSQEQHDQTYQETVECVPFASTIDAGAEWFLCHDPGDEVIEVAISFFDDRGQALENLFYTESEVDTALASKAEAADVTTLQTDVGTLETDVGTLEGQVTDINDAFTLNAADTRSALPFVVPSLTDAQIGAGTWVAGTILFNSDTSKLQGYDGTTWQDLHA